MILKAEQLSRRFFRQGEGRNVFYALRDVSLEIAPGTLTEITGRSGSGKSTLLNLLSGLLEPTEGRVLLDGRDLYAMPDGERSRLRNSAFGLVPQGQTGLLSLTVGENVLLPGQMYQMPPGAGARAAELLERLGIGHLADAYPGELSGGELRRMAVARALVMGPAVLLADEPTSDLDGGNVKTVLSLLREQADAGLAVLLVTHEREAAAYADRRFVMDGGNLRSVQ